MSNIPTRTHPKKYVFVVLFLQLLLVLNLQNSVQGRTTSAGAIAYIMSHEFDYNATMNEDSSVLPKESQHGSSSTSSSHTKSAAASESHSSPTESESYNTEFESHSTAFESHSSSSSSSSSSMLEDHDNNATAEDHGGDTDEHGGNGDDDEHGGDGEDDGHGGGGGGGGEDDGHGSSSNSVCSNHNSFLGVGNSLCIHGNMALSATMIAFIVIVSLILDFAVETIRHGLECPQMRKIVNRIFEEVMILGFISMLLFSLDSFGVITDLAASLSDYEERHFREFFHFLIFFSTVYYILVMLLLLAIGTVVPRWLLNTLPIDDETILSRRESALACRRMYKDIIEHYDSLSLFQKCFNLWARIKQWKHQQELAYYVCRDRSRPIYYNSHEMQRIFELSEKKSKKVNYIQYNRLCMRMMLSQITSMHWSGHFVLVGVVILTTLSPEDDENVFLAIGLSLLLLSTVIMIKTSNILQGILKDRFSTISKEKIQKIIKKAEDKKRNKNKKALLLKDRVYKKTSSTVNNSKTSDDWIDEVDEEGQQRKLAKQPSNASEGKPPSFKTVALSVRAVIRMQMSMVCHQGLYRHDDLFWNKSPLLLLRMFQFASFGQAFYLVWFSLVQWHSILDGPNTETKLLFTMAIPVLSLLVILPFTLPSLVLVLSLVGYFVEQDEHFQHQHHSKAQGKKRHANMRDHIRSLRRSYIQRTTEPSADIV